MPEDESSCFIIGKKGARYVKHCAFSIQPQNYPDAINHVSEIILICVLI